MEATRLLRCYSLKLLEAYVEIVNLRLDGAIREKWMTVGWEGRRM
jgi:hypothetical protein